MYHIYKIENKVNGKLYIGFTSQKPTDRWNDHKSVARNGGQQVIHRAMRKYGEENFTFEVIYSSQDQDHTLTVMEPYFIEEYGDYNTTKGGEGVFGLKHSEESIQRMKNRVLSDEHRERMAAAKRGVKLPEEQRRAISEAMKGKKKSDEHRAKLRKPKSDEVKDKISAAKGSPVTINGVTYVSKGKAAAALNISLTTFLRHLKQGKYGNQAA